MTKVFDIMPGWLYALAIVALLGLVGVQQVRVANAHAETDKVAKEFADAKAQAADEARKAEQAAREEEQRREQRLQEIQDEADHQTELAKASAADAAATADGLRKQLAVYIAAAHRSAANPTTAGAGETADDPVDLLAKLYSESDSRAAELALYADAARRAGQTCEASYDSLTVK